MYEYKERLCRLALHDDAFVEGILSAESAPPELAFDQRTASLVRLAAMIAVDAAPSSFQHTVELALGAGATTGEIVGTLEAVAPVTGAARVVLCAPKLALALGYDVEEAIEKLDS